MKELFDKFPSEDLSKARDFILIDTCFLIHAVEHNYKEFLTLPNKAMITFNIEELLKVEHKLKSTKTKIRKFLKEVEDFTIINIPVHPGEWEREKEFIRAIDHELLNHCQDNSDAVLLASAIETRSIILTKDKHHIFTGELENFLNKYKIAVYKELKDVV